MRPQYHLRNSERGLLAWDVRKLIRLTRDLTPVSVPLSSIRELDEPFWFHIGDDLPTCRKIAEHARLIEESDLRYPILMDAGGRVLDGMHRVCKAFNLGLQTITAYQLPELPPPDFIGVPPDALPYEPGDL